MKTCLFLALAAASVPFTSAEAAQFTIAGDIFGPGGYVTTYTGAGTQGGNLGVVNDGGSDAFDGYGYYCATSGLAFTRQTEAFGGQNLYRFFDTFTNNSAERVTRTVTFLGNLGSDSRTQLQANGLGFSVTCEFSDHCGHDPVVALIYGNNGLGEQTISGEYSTINYTLTLDPGQSASILNFAFLASDLSGTNAADVALAIERARNLVVDPMLAGLTDRQLRRIVNFDLGVPAAVPEPSSWALMILGFGAIGASMRRRTVVPAYA